MNQREKSYDLLKIISAAAVIIIHVSSNYINAITNDAWLGKYYREHLLAISAYNAMSRFAVPCFIMISGALLLGNEKNADYSYFYRKEFKAVGIPTLIFSVLYFLFNLSIQMYRILNNDAGVEVLLGPVRGVMVGAPNYHLWYLYMMIPMYVMAPFLIRLKKDIGERKFARVSMVFFPLAMVSLWTSSHRLNWDLGYSFCYMGYFLIGYTIHKYCSVKNNVKAIGLITAGFLGVGAVMAYFRFRQALAGIADAELKYSLIDPSAPLVVCGSLLIFAGFTKLKLGVDFSKLAKLTFYIYLFHAGLWTLMSQAIAPQWDARVVIPVSAVLVFALSVLCSLIYQGWWKWVSFLWANKTVG